MSVLAQIRLDHQALSLLVGHFDRGKGAAAVLRTEISSCPNVLVKLVLAGSLEVVVASFEGAAYLPGTSSAAGPHRMKLVLTGILEVVAASSFEGLACLPVTSLAAAASSQADPYPSSEDLAGTS